MTARPRRAPAPLARLLAALPLLLSPSLAERDEVAEGTLRLVSAVTTEYGYLAGRLQISHLDKWGSICYYDFYYYDTEVACRQLGLGWEEYNYYYSYYYAYYQFYDDQWKFPRTEEDTGLIWHGGGFGCHDDSPTLLDCEWEKDWGDHFCEVPDRDEVIIFCPYPSKPTLQNPNFVLDIGFSRSETKCVSVEDDLEAYALDRYHTHEYYDDYRNYNRRRRSGTYTPIANTTTAACMSVYHGGVQETEVRWSDGSFQPWPQDIFDISHRADEVCVTRTDGMRVWWGYLRLLCQFVDLTSPLVSYKVKGSCGPRGGDVQADASECPSGLSALYTVSNRGFPVALLADCPILEYTVHECASEAAPPMVPACDDFSPAGGGSWHDTDGEQFDCAWYNRSSMCSASTSNFGRSPAQACCSCGGGAAEVRGSVAFRSTGTQGQVENATRAALSELLGVDAGAFATLQVLQGESRTTTTGTSTTTATETETTTSTGTTVTINTTATATSTATDTGSATSSTTATTSMTTVSTDVNASATSTTGSTTVTTSTVDDADTTWWSADYTLSLSLGDSRSAVDSGANLTDMEELLSQSFDAAGLFLDLASFAISAPQIAMRPAPAPVVPAKADEEEKEEEEEESSSTAGLAVGMGVGGAALLLGGVAAAMALRRSGYARWTQTGQAEDVREALQDRDVGASRQSGGGSRVFDV